MKLKSIFLAILGIGIAGVAGFAFYARQPELPELAEVGRPQFEPETIEKGRVLTAAGYCASCHTAKDGAPFAGNYPVTTDFGTIYGSNITPDPETGIGGWSPEAFRRAMQKGVDRDGAHLFPAFPYDHFSKMTDEDVDAIYAYLMAEVEPVRQQTLPPELPAPLDRRFLQAGWKLLFADLGRYESDLSKSELWNRGAYLTQGVTHCGACHTPRNALGAERDQSALFEGAVIDNWHAPPLTAANPAAVPWSAADFVAYLSTGSTRYQGVATGPMGPVVHQGIAMLPQSDLEAIGTYLASIVGAPDADPAGNQVVIASLEAGRPGRDWRMEPGARLYATACAACHYNAREVSPGRPDLAINSAARLDDPANLIQAILHGVSVSEGTSGVVMPAFAGAMSDAEIAAIASHIREGLAGLPAWPDLAAKIAMVRAAGTDH